MPLRDNFVLDNMLVEQGDRPALIDAQRALLSRAAMLLPRDRTLVELAIKNHASHRQLARMLDLPPGTVSRRLRKLLNRLHEPIVLALLSGRVSLPEEHRQLGVEYFLQGLTIRELSDRHCMNRPEIRRMLEYVKGWHLAVGRPTRRW